MHFKKVLVRASCLLAFEGVLLPLCDLGYECIGQTSPPAYKVIDLGPTLVRAVVDTPGLNDHGDTALWLSIDGSRTRGVTLRGTQSTEIVGSPEFSLVYPSDISDHGVIVGSLQDPRDMRFTRAFKWHEGELKVLSPLGGKETAASAINGRGDIVGKAQTVGGAFHAALWTADSVEDLGTLPHGDFSEARDVNSKGLIVGSSNTSPNGKPHAFVREKERMIQLPDAPGGTLCGAQAVNDKTEIVGFCELSSGNSHAVLWRGSHITDLGPQEGDPDDTVSTAVDINNHSQIVGFYEIEDGKLTAFLWQRGSMLNLNKLIPAHSGWNLVIAWRINDLGEILGRGYYRDGMHVFLLVPQPSPADHIR